MTFDDDGPLQGAGALPRVQGAGAGGGGGKGGGGSASSAPDTLFSTATVRLVDLLGEGEIVGVRGGLKGVYLNDVPVQNEDDSYNFKGLTAEFRVGTPDQPYMAGYPDVQTPRNVGIKVNQATPVTVSITDTDVDRLRVTVQVPSLILAKSDGSVRANSVSYRVQARYSGGPWVNSLGDQTITGKTTSGYFRSHEIALPINPSGASAPWQVQVIRLSPDTDDFNNSQAKFTNQSDLVFYSTTSIVDARFSYPHSAMVGLTAQAASFGSSVPGRTYLVDGVLMPIPSNYDPVARTYSGVWDGTFKEGFSNNPAWALNLILRNDRFGLGEFIDTAAIDKWSLYEIGRYCDVPVSDGKGGQEPRYVFNGAISTQQEAFELLQLIAQVFRGTVYWSSGTVTAAQDRPSDPVLLVTEANAIEGENGEVFAYASSGRRARHTVALVAWNDPDNLYKQTIEVVEDSDGVARYGYNPTRIDLLGCTSRGQAHRTGLWTLFTELHQTQVLTYRAGLDHAVIRPGDIVAVQDPQIANLDLSGRLMGGSTASVLVLDRPVTLASGATYTISVVMPDGTVQEREISTGAGTVSSVTLRSALPQVPDPAAVWLIAGPIEPQLFRVVSIREEEPHIYAVAALQHEPGKYATIDDGAAFEPSPITEFPNIVLPPTNLSVRESQYTELGQPKQAMTLSWLPGQAFNSVAYFVTVIRPSGATVTTRTASQSIDFLEAEVGVWTFVVVAIGLNGKSSLPAQTAYTLSGWAGQAATTVASLSIKGGGSTFTGRSCTVAWTNQIAASVPPYPVRNAVYVFDASTQAMVHREVLPASVTEWTYDYFLNVNEGGPRRQFRVGVTAYSAAGDEGPPSYLTVSNPAPEIIVPTLGATSEVLFVDLPKVADADFAGYLVWVSETPNINPLTAPSYDVAGNSFPYRGVPDKTYYVRAAAYDAFSKDPAQLNVSAEQSKKLTIQIFDPLAPPIPGTPTLASNVAEIAPDGAVTAKVTIQWLAVTSTNLATYEVAIAEGNNPAQAAYVGGRVVSGTTAAFAGLMPGRQYSFKVRSNPLNGFADSGWSAVLVVTAALNTTPPNAPALFTADPSFEAANLAWANPSNKDLLGIEIWAGITNVLANATLLKTVPAPASFYRDVLGTTATKFYWIRAVNTSDFKSGFVGPQSVTSVALVGAQLAAGVIDATKLASSIAANTVVTTLPTAKTTDYVTFGGEQYRWDTATNKYTKAVASTDISGKIIAAQIDTVNKEAIATALAQSAIQTSQLSGNLDATRISGALTSDQIASLNAAKVAGTLTAANIDFARLMGTIAGTQIAAGSIVGSKLAVVSTNMAFNPDASQGRRGWTIGGSMPAGVDAGVSVSWAPDGFKAIFTSSTATASAIGSSYIDLYTQNVSADGVFSNYTVAANVTYEFSACISPHRCAGRIIVQWLNASGGHISFSDNASRVVNQQVSQGAYAAFPKSAMIAVAPTGAVSARVFFRMDSVVGDNPYMFVSAFMMAATRTGATETSPYVAPGITTIDGSGIVSNSITTRVIAAGAITADQIGANAVTATKILAGSVQTGHMVAGTIDANRLVAQSITAGLLAANSVTAEKVLAGSITASKLTLADTTNALLNGHFLNQSSEGWALYGDTGIDVASADDQGGQWRLTGTTEMYFARSAQWIQVTPGEILYLSTMVYSNRNAGSAGIYLEFYNQADGGGFGAFTATRSEKGSWVKGEGQVTVPVGRQKVRVVLYADAPGTGRVFFGKVQVRRANGAELIVDGAITTNKLVANAVTSDKITANAITTAHISAGAIKADQLDVGAVTAAKLGVGLNTGNLIWNSEGTADGLNGGAAGTQPNPICDMVVDWKVNGSIRSIRLHHTNPTNGAYNTTDIQNPAAGGGYTWEIPVQGGKRYEFSCYVSVHGPCRAYIQAHFNDGNGFFPGNTSNIMNTNGRQGAPGDDWRCKIMVDAPGTAQKVLLRLVVEYQGTSACWGFFSGFYLGIAGANTTAFSEWTLQSRTVISGGQISTNSLNANRIVARTITADRLALRSILAENLVANTITGEEIAVGGVHANRIQSNTITATQIAANSISASRLNIELRGIMPVNIYFEMERDGNGNPTGWLKWTAGQIEYIDHNGNRAFSQIPAGRMQRGSDGWVTVWFNIAAPGQLQANSGNNIAGIRADPNCILVATSADLTGVIVNWGGTVIDGDKIVANSIQARNIAANQIQTTHMAANSINGDRIAAGTISADKITTGTLTVNAVFSLGSNSQTDLYAHPNGGIFRVRNRQLNQWRAAFGYVGDWTGDGNDFGLLLWGADGVNRLRFSNAVNFIDGVIISDATIQNAKIANLTIGNEKVQSEAITRGAFATTGAGGADTSVGLTIRNPGTRVVIWVARTGAAGQRYLTGAVTGQLQIYWARPGQGWELIRAIPNAFMYEYVNGQGNYLQHLPTSDMCQVGTLEGGYYQFRVLDTSAAGASSVSICAVEFSK